MEAQDHLRLSEEAAFEFVVVRLATLGLSVWFISAVVLGVLGILGGLLGALVPPFGAWLSPRPATFSSA